MHRMLCAVVMMLIIGCGGPAVRISERPVPAPQLVMEEPSVEAIGDAYLINLTPEEAKQHTIQLCQRFSSIPEPVRNGLWTGSRSIFIT